MEVAERRPVGGDKTTDRAKAFGRLADEHLNAAYRLARAILRDPSEDNTAVTNTKGNVGDGVHKYTFRGNWKLQLENTVDMYHVPFSHESTVRRSGKQFGRRAGEDSASAISDRGTAAQRWEQRSAWGAKSSGHSYNGHQPIAEQLPDDLHGGVAVLAVLVVVVLAPIAEELYFRGILFRSVRDVRGPGVGIAVSAALFGLVHYAPAEGAGELVLPLVMVLTGAVLAVLYERSGNLVVPIAAHMAFNAIGVTLILSGWG